MQTVVTNYKSSKKVDNFSGQVQHWETMMHGGTGGDYMQDLSRRQIIMEQHHCCAAYHSDGDQ